MNIKNILIASLILSMPLQAENDLEISIIKPKSIVFGQKLNEVKVALQPLCSKQSSKEIKPAQIPGTKTRQVQIDCHGYRFAGKDRLAEFVFKDDELFLVWVMVDKNDLIAIEKKMMSEYSSVNYKNDLFSAFTSHHTALRKDVPEVLFYANQAAEQFETWFQSAN